MKDLRSLVTKIIQKTKGDTRYEVDPEIAAGALLVELRRRAVGVALAQWRLRHVRGSHLRFVERGIEIRHRRHCSIGKGSVIEAYARLHCLSRDGITIGRSVTIGKFSIIECTSALFHLGAGVRIGDASAVGDYCFIGGAGGVEIGSNVLMGQRVSIHSQNHEFRDADRSISEQGTTQEGVRIGDDCWIGSGAVILDGVSLGRGCVVAAGSVVTKSFPAHSVIAGVPGKAVTSRATVETAESA